MMRRTLPRAVGAAFAARRDKSGVDPSAHGASRDAATADRAEPPPRPAAAAAAAASNFVPLPVRDAKTLHEIIGLPNPTRAGQYSPEDIKAAFRKRAKKSHPDCPGGTEEDFQRVFLAFERLKGAPNDTLQGTGPAPGSDGQSSNFYDHPHHRPKPVHMHTTRSRVDGASQHVVHEGYGEFTDFANEFYAATARGDYDWLRRRREADKQRREEHAQRYYNTATREEAAHLLRERSYRSLGTLLQVCVASLFLYGVLKVALVPLQVNFEAHDATRYPPEYIDKLKGTPNAPKPARPDPSSFTPEYRSVYATTQAATGGAAAGNDTPVDNFFREVTKANHRRRNDVVGLSYMGKPFTVDGVAEARRQKADAKKNKTMRSDEAALAGATGATAALVEAAHRRPSGGHAAVVDDDGAAECDLEDAA